MATKSSGTPPAETSISPAASVVFTSPHASLIVYHKDKKIAGFAGGRFETRDPATIAALRERGQDGSWLYPMREVANDD